MEQEQGTPNFQTANIIAQPLFWVMDAGTGFLQFYGETSNLQAAGVKDIKINSIQDKDWAPTISCFIYNGKTGITNLDVSGQVQVGDIGSSLRDISNIQRMILPDGSANVLDLSDNDAIRTQYEYIRKNLFIGYPTQPDIDNSNVLHTQDPSLNSVFYELDVSGNTRFGGNVAISGNLDTDGLIESIGNTRFVDFRDFSVDISGAIAGYHTIATCENKEFADGLFVVDDNTSGVRQTIIFMQELHFLEEIISRFYQIIGTADHRVLPR